MNKENSKFLDSWIPTYNICVSPLRMEIKINLRARTTGSGDPTGPEVVFFTHPLYSLFWNTNLIMN